MVLRVYDSATHEAVTTIELPPELRIASNLQLSAQGDRIAVGVVRQPGEGNWEMFLRIHDGRSGELQASAKMPNLFRTIALSPDGNQLAIGYTDTTVVSWDVNELIAQFKSR